MGALHGRANKHRASSHALQALRPGAVILMGKNTMMKRSIRLHCETTGNDKWASVLDQLVGNVGIIFTNGDLGELKDEIEKYKVCGGGMHEGGGCAPVHYGCGGVPCCIHERATIDPSSCRRQMDQSGPPCQHAGAGAQHAQRSSYPAQTPPMMRPRTLPSPPPHAHATTPPHADPHRSAPPPAWALWLPTT